MGERFQGGRLALLGLCALAGAARAEPAWPDFQAQVATAKGAMTGSLPLALESARRAGALARARPPSAARTEALATAGWLEGEALTRSGQAKAAEPVIAAALQQARGVAPGGRLEGDLLKARGSAEAAQAQVQLALADFQAAFRVYQRLRLPRSQALVLQELGNIYTDAHDYAHSSEYFSRSLETFSADPALVLSVNNNLGWNDLKTGRDEQALAAFTNALSIARGMDSRMTVVRVLSNIALAQLKLGRLDAAAAAIDEGFRLGAPDGAGGAWRIPLLDARAQLDSRRGDLAAARAAMDQAFAGEDLGRTGAWFSSAHATAWKVYAAAGDTRLALAHLAAYKRLDDQARDLAASTNAALMGARFDFANQNLAIARLRAQTLERDVALERTQARGREALLASVLAGGGVALLLVLAGLVLVSRNRNVVRAANRRLETSNAALERALKAKSQFLATTSHEIRTPLNGVLGMTQVLLADRALPPSVRGRVELVHGAGETMRALVDDILDLAKMETGRVTVEKRSMDLGRLLDEVTRLWRAEAQTKGLSLQLQADEAPGWIVEDAARLRQVLSNLLGNACKFTDVGEIVLNAAARDGRLVITVADTGIGIAPDDQARVFEPFTQVDGGTTRRFAGTGLGLAICRDIARALGGDVAVASRLGEGSVFTLDLPLATAAGAAGGGAAAAPGRWPEALDAARVLVLEPNPLVRSILRNVLAPVTADVELAADLPAALERLRRGGVHHVLAAGEALGAEPEAAADACGALTLAAGDAHVSLLLTGASTTLAAALARSGATQLLTRPIPPERLVASLREALAPAPAGPAAERDALAA